MKCKSVTVQKREIFNLETLSFNSIPNQSRLFLDLQSNVDTLHKFYPEKNTDIERYTDKVLRNCKVSRQRLCDILHDENITYGVSDKTLDNIERLRNDDCVAVLTGQQAGLFSGPIYTIYKALSAIKLAAKLNTEGINAVPIFWVASEDHDFDEIKKTTSLDKDFEIFHVENNPNNLADDLPVGFIEIDETIKKTCEEFFGSLAETQFSSQLEVFTKEVYSSGETFSGAFTKLLAKLFSEFGLIFVSAINKELRELSSPVFVEAIKNANKITSELLERNSDLAKSKYHSQVLVEEDFFPFFYVDNDNKRNALRFDKSSSKIKSQNGKFEFTEDELVEIAQKSPWKLSPNALMRPVIQDYLFPTVCYFGGGAEMAYFGQNSVIYELLGRPVTPIRHRSSFTIVEARNRKTLDKYDLNFAGLFSGKESVSAEIVEKYINTPTAKVFTETEELIKSQLDALDRALVEDEPTLSESLCNRRRKILWQISSLKKKFHQAEITKDEVVHRRIENLYSGVLPHDVLQERNVNAMYFLNKYGENFIQWIYDSIDLEEKDHQLIIF